MKGMKKEEVEEEAPREQWWGGGDDDERLLKMAEQVKEEEDWVEPVGSMEEVHRPGRNLKRGRRLRLRALEQEVHV
jgi:hypothetical protein